MDRYYTASEAIKKLNIRRSTFFVLAQTGQIPKVNVPLRKQALYPKDEIDKLAAERAKILEGAEKEIAEFRFVLPSPDDFKQIVEIDKMLFPGETWMAAEELQQRLAYNPEVTHVLKNISTNSVVGYISMSPIKQQFLERLIKLEIDETLLKPEDFIPYTPDSSIDCYIISVAAKPGPGIAQQIYAGKLIYAIKDYLLELLERGIIIQHIYTVATTKEGDKIAQGLCFTPLEVSNQSGNGYEEFRKPYVLNLNDKTSQSELVKSYQKKLTNRDRRIKRYVAQEKTGKKR